MEFRRAILGFLRQHPSCTLAELVREVPGCAGDCTMGTAFRNLILWKGISREAVDALFALEKSGALRFEHTTLHSYGQEGRELGLPYAMKLRDFDTPHWLPVLIHVTARE
jgi:hypothetical protein